MITDVAEEAHGRLVLPLTRLDGTALPWADVTEVRIRLRDHHTRTILNGRDGSAANAPNVAGEGAATVWTLQPADNVVVRAASDYELHDYDVAYVYGTVLQRLTGLIRVENRGIAGLTPAPEPDPEAPTWSFDVPLTGARPGNTFTVPTAPQGIQVYYQGYALTKKATPGIGEFFLSGNVITTGFDVQEGDALWAHVFA